MAKPQPKGMQLFHLQGLGEFVSACEQVRRLQCSEKELSATLSKPLRPCVEPLDMPKSTSQTSPLLTPGIFLLHAVEHHRSFRRHLVAELNILLPGGKIRKHTTHGSLLGLAELRQCPNNLDCAHARYTAPAVSVGQVRLLVNACGAGWIKLWFGPRGGSAVAGRLPAAPCLVGGKCCSLRSR